MRQPEKYKLADENSNTYKLRNDLMEFAKSKKIVLTGKTEEGEGYILFYGYEPQYLGDLPISDKLRDKLGEVRPPEETARYVLAHFRKDDILDYTEWKIDGHPYDHPNLIYTPFLIRGDYTITQRLDQYKRVIMEIKN